MRVHALACVCGGKSARMLATCACAPAALAGVLAPSGRSAGRPAGAPAPDMPAHRRAHARVCACAHSSKRTHKCTRAARMQTPRICMRTNTRTHTRAREAPISTSAPTPSPHRSRIHPLPACLARKASCRARDARPMEDSLTAAQEFPSCPTGRSPEPGPSSTTDIQRPDRERSRLLAMPAPIARNMPQRTGCAKKPRAGRVTQGTQHLWVGSATPQHMRALSLARQRPAPRANATRPLGSRGAMLMPGPSHRV